ncbi:MAG: hypothetical protein R3F48_12820 [Candidatus Zixiibacteriota bacterium]
MAKKQSFADKANKKRQIDICPICNTEISHIKLVQAQKKDGGWRMTNKPVGVCKCNEAEIYG